MMKENMLFEECNERYGLTEKDISKLFGKTEASIRKDIFDQNVIGQEITNILASPEKTLSLVEANKFTSVKTTYNKVVQKIWQQIDNEYNDVIKGYAFVKKVKKNELGFRKDGEKGAGSFVLIPKKCAESFWENITKELDIRTENGEYVPFVEINICFHARDDREVYVPGYNPFKLTYQNGRRLEDPSFVDNHDEYRLYSVKSGIELRPEDYIVITENPCEENKYDFIVIHKEEVESYEKIDRIVEKRRTGAATAAIVPLYEFVKNAISIHGVQWSEYCNVDVCDNNSDSELVSINTDKKIIDEDTVNRMLELALIQDDIVTAKRHVNAIVRDSKFRNAILSQYGYRCAVTGHSMVYGNKACLQGCHIYPKNMGGSDNPKNGICLEYNMHWLFDNGFFTITQDYKVRVHENVMEKEEFAYLSKYDGSLIFLPNDRRLWPDKEQLKKHEEYVYGSFCKN